MARAIEIIFLNLTNGHADQSTLPRPVTLRRLWALSCRR